MSDAARERAIEALLDLDPRSPYFRLTKILNEGPHELEKWRPTLITDAALLDVANSLADYQIASPSHGEFLGDLSDRIDSAVTSPPFQGGDSKVLRNRIMRHHDKLVASRIAKSSLDKMDFTSDLLKAHSTETHTVKGSVSCPPSQLISLLRSVYEFPISSDDTLENTSSATQLQFSSVLDSLQEHPIFSSSFREREGKVMSSQYVEGKHNESMDITSSSQLGENNAEEKSDIEEDIANVESIIGDVCFLHSLQMEGSNYSSSLDAINGYLIAALCIYGSFHEQKDIVTEDTLLQVGGVLSLIAEKYVNLEHVDPELKIDQNQLLNWRDVIHTFEERLEKEQRNMNVTDHTMMQDIHTSLPSTLNTHSKRDDVNAGTDSPSPSHPIDAPGSPTDETGPQGNFDSSSDDDDVHFNSRGQSRIFLSAGAAFEEEDDEMEEEDDDDDEDEDMDDEEQDEDEEFDFHDAEVEEDEEDYEEMHEEFDTNDEEPHQDSLVAAETAEDNSMNQAPLPAQLTVEGTSQAHSPVSDNMLHVESIPVHDNAMDICKSDPSDELFHDNSLGLDIASSPLSNDTLADGIPNIAIENIHSSRVLCHLLVVASGILEEKLRRIYTPLDKPCARCYGGVASSLFPPTILAPDFTPCNDPKISSTIGSAEKDALPDGMKILRSEILAFHLLVALIHFLVDTRNMTALKIDTMIDDIRTSCEHDEQTSQSYDVDETDDPASAYLGGDIQSWAKNISSTSTAFEEKGLLRKAAAAVRSSTIVRENVRLRVLDLCAHLQFISTALGTTLKCLRDLILHRSSESLFLLSSDLYEQPVDHSVFTLPNSRMRLHFAISQLVSSGSLLQYGAMNAKVNTFSNECSIVFKKALRPLILFQEGIRMWGECLPLLYPAPGALKDQFDHLMQFCVTSYTHTGNDPLSADILLHSLDGLQLLEHIEKLQVMCWRLRRVDMLALMVPKPVRYSKRNAVTSRSISRISTEDISTFDRTLSYMASLRGGSSSIGTFPRLSNIRKLYRAVCHRIIFHWILWNRPLRDDKLNEDDEFRENDQRSSLRMAQSSFNDFNSSKCPDTITIMSDANIGHLAVQKASRVWGTVLGLQGYKPKSGIHHWAVRLDQCEKGHIFVGVATNEASIKTYVGGDSHGWGLIGTRALWHDRRKIRTDYGKTFRSGLIIVVTLDTEAGTIRFGVLDDANGSNSESSGSYTEWGVAFEGLPLNSVFFPAVGLYQREDRVTLMGLEVTSPFDDPYAQATNKHRKFERSFYPPESSGEELEKRKRKTVRYWNTALCDHVISFVSDILLRTCNYLTSEESIATEGIDLFENILPSVAASLSLFPVHIPYISMSVAVDVLPLLVKCCTLLGERLKGLNDHFPNAPMQTGAWVVRLTPVDLGDSASDSMVGVKHHEFQVCFDQSKVERSDVITFEGSGIFSNSEKPENSIFIAGIATGTLIRLVQVIEKNPGEGNKSRIAYMVDGRLNMDGTMFEGIFSDTLGHVKGKIAGIFRGKYKNSNEENVFNIRSTSRLSSLLSNATRHMCLVLNSCDVSTETHPLSRSPLLSGGLRTLNSASILEDMYHFNVVGNVPTRRNNCDEVVSSHKRFAQFIEDHREPLICIQSSGSLYDEVKALDILLTVKSGGVGSLRSLSPIEYDSTRLKVITSIIHIKRLSPQYLSAGNADDEDLRMIWLMSLRVMEDNIRKALSFSVQRSNLKAICCSQCATLQLIADFLLQMNPPSTVDSSDVEGFYSSLAICSREDVIQLMGSVQKTDIRNLFKAFSLMTIHNLLQLNHPLSIIHENALLSLSAIMGPGSYVAKSCDSELTKCDSFWGAHQATQQSIQSLLSLISRRLVEFTSSIDVKGGVCVTYSLSLALFSVFFTNMRSPDIVAIVEHGHTFWVWFNSLLQISKLSLEWNKPTRKVLDMCDALENANRRFASLNLLRCSILAINCAFMHLNAVGSSDYDLKSPTSLIKAEIASIVNDVSEEQLLLHRDAFVSDVEQDFKRLQRPPSNELRVRVNPDESFQITVISNLESSFAVTMLQNFTRLSCYEFSSFALSSKSYYLHLLIDACSNMIFSSSQSMISSLFDLSWAHALLVKALPSNQNGSMLPLTCSKRILRLFRIILPTLNAETLFVEHILRFVGSNQISFERSELLVNELSENDIYILSTECISLLRLLYGGVTQSWRRCISVILEGMTGADHELAIGALAFLGGLPSRLTTGSWILTKPGSALTPPVSRRFGSSVTTTSTPLSPKTIASGLDGLMHGLCRHESQVGIVCTVDNEGGYCDVIFIDSCNANEEKDDRKRQRYLGFRSSRVLISNISIAEENSLAFDCDTPLTLLTDLPSHFTSDEKTNLFDSTKLLFLLRSYGNVLTRKSTFEILYRNIQSMELSPFSTLLQIASDSFTSEHPKLTPILHDHLFNIPDYEARYWLIRGMIFELIRRRHVINSNYHLGMQSAVGSNPDGNIVTACDSVQQDVKEPDESISLKHDDPSSRTSSFASLQLSRENTNNGEEEDEDDEAAHNEGDETAFEHLREVVILQMAELGLPRSWSEFSLQRVGGINIEAAVHFCLEHASEMERLIAEQRERHESHEQSSTTETGPGRNGDLLRQLVDMGFPSRWCEEALVNTNRNLDDALNWILTNGERLSALDDGNGDIDVDNDEEDNEVNESTVESDRDYRQTESNRSSVSMILDPSSDIAPLFEISGSCNINQQTLEVSGSPNGGFSSVGTKGVLLTEGKYYYEVILLTAGCIQVGWADSTFSGHCSADRGDGCGDGPSSWAYDGWRKYLWHKNATVWGCQWQEGDIVGCLLDLDSKTMSFTLNGRGEEIGMGIAFSGDGFRYSGGVYACISFNRKERVKFLLGGPFGTCRFTPEGYNYVGNAIIARKKEWDTLLEGEKIIGSFPSSESQGLPNVIRDLSDEEHGYELFLWQHRYCTDACVHMQTNMTEKFIRGLTSKAEDADPKKSSYEKSLCAVHLDKLLHSSRTQIADDTNWSYGQLQKLYDALAQNLVDDLYIVTLAISHLYARKLIAQLAAMMSSDFDLKIFRPPQRTMEDYSEDDKLSAYVFWCVLEDCCSLYNLGWTGESSVMILTTELLNIGVVGFDSRNGRSRRHTNLRFACIGDDSDDLPLAIMSSTLNCVQTRRSLSSRQEDDTSFSYPACFESTLVGDSGGFVIFLRAALQNAVVHSTSLMNIILAVIRRSVRVLSAGEDTNPSAKDHQHHIPEGEKTEAKKRIVHDRFSVDARLVSFLSGLLLSEIVTKGLQCNENPIITAHVCTSLIESWSVGLLSPSVPWRTICAWTVVAVLDRHPEGLAAVTTRSPSLCVYYENLASKVSRRIWTERSAAPIFSHYLQALMELLLTVRRASTFLSFLSDIPPSFQRNLSVDAAAPIPIQFDLEQGSRSSDAKMKGNSSDSLESCWEWDEGWVDSDNGWDVWLGTVEYSAANWTPPPPSAVRSLIDGGEGPPMLREGCTVVRGIDWAAGDEDGKDFYEREKNERAREMKSIEENSPNVPSENTVTSMNDDDDRKTRNYPMLPTGKVISIESWNGVAGTARRVHWSRTGAVGLYRFGGDGGRFDIAHVEANKKGTRIMKRYPFPETLEQAAVRCGFGYPKLYNILLRVRMEATPSESDDSETDRVGILEWPDFGAAVLVNCRFHHDGAITLTEKRLIYGSNDSGWEARFGKPNYEPGTVIVLSPLSDSNLKKKKNKGYEELLGSASFVVDKLRNKADGNTVRVSFEMRLIRGESNMKRSKVPALLPPIQFDKSYHANSIAISIDGMTATCLNADGRGCAFSTVGFCKGVHYWEVKIEQAESGSIFIGVAEKNSNKSNSSQDSVAEPDQPRLNKWYGWGFVNFRTTYNSGVEKVYGTHCHSGDTVGVLLDCDSGRLSFFVDSIKYGEHILSDLGCAFEALSPFGFTGDGCGSGGAGRGASKAFDSSRSGRFAAFGAVRPKALWPVIGLRHVGDRVTFSGKWMTSYGIDGVSMLRNACAVDDILLHYSKKSIETRVEPSTSSAIFSDKAYHKIPHSLRSEAFYEYKRWREDRWYRTGTRGSGPLKLAFNNLFIDLDRTPFACAIACANIGLGFVLLPGDKVRVKRSAGRILELTEEALVLGAYQGRLWYRLISQRSDGGSLSEGGDRAWFWNESEVVKESLVPTGSLWQGNIELPMLSRFKCTAPGGLRVIYSGGAVMRTDLEIFAESTTLGIISFGTIIPQQDVLECRVNSCGVLRYRVKYNPLGEGWISERIRGGKEDLIVESMPALCTENNITLDGVASPEEAAQIWLKSYNDFLLQTDRKPSGQCCGISSLTEFENILQKGVISTLSPVESDSTFTAILNLIAENADGHVLNLFFDDVSSILAESLSLLHRPEMLYASSLVKNVSMLLTAVGGEAPPVNAIMARMSLLRAFNRRAVYALPLISLQSPQEISSILGGPAGLGASIDIIKSVGNIRNHELWFQSVSSLGMRLREFRALLFTDIKTDFLSSLIEVTTSLTPLSHDEYEFPRDIRTVRVNRVKARAAIASSDSTQMKKQSVFSQLYNEVKSWTGTSLRRSFIAKGHGGQKRAFKVKLVGEGVNDYSGPYREVFADALGEVFLTDEDGNGYLGLTVRTANAVSDVGEDRNLFVLAGDDADDLQRTKLMKSSVSTDERLLLENYSWYLGVHRESQTDIGDSIFFLGLLCGIALRHNIQLDLSFPLHTFWKRLCAEPVDGSDCLKEIDYLGWRRLFDNEDMHDESVVSPPPVLQQRMLNMFAQGLSLVVPTEVFTLFTGSELQTLFCGKAIIDIQLLKSVAEYDGFDEDSETVQNFWAIMESFSEEERKLFLQFVWSRRRLPSKKSDFESTFKIQKDAKPGSESSLPSASTCFFTLTLPVYRDQETMRDKILFAINNVTTMESDYVTNDAEIGEGWRHM